MRIIDAVALIAYITTLLNIVYLIPAFFQFFAWQVKVRAVSWLMIGIFGALGAYGAQMATGFWRRYIRIAVEAPDTSPIATIWTIEQAIIAVCLCLISWLFATRNTDRFINPPKRGE